MFNAAIITFRELIEISLLLSVISASLKDYQYKKLVLGFGTSIGIIFSILIAASFNYITDTFDGLGQELLNIFILSLAITCIAWTLHWINNQQSKFPKNIVDKKENNKLFPLIILIILALCREGAELVLFLGGLFINGLDYKSLAMGAIFGASLGILLGLTIYFGLLSLPYKKFFRIVNFLFIIIACNMGAQIASNLTAGDFVNFLSERAWDTSWLLIEDSYIGNILASVTGYNSKPSFLEVLFYFFTLVALLSITLRKSKPVAK